MSLTTTTDDRQTEATLLYGRLIIAIIYQLVIQQISLSIENSFSSLLLQYVHILEVQKRPIVHYCAVRTSTSVHLNQHVNSSFSSSQYKYTQLDTSETSSHNVISLCSVVSSLIINAMR